MKKISMVFALVLCLGLGFAQKSHAAFYKYIDKDGVVCFTDNLQVIPENCRANAVLVEDEANGDMRRPAAPVAAQTEAAPIAQETPPQVSAALSLSSRLMISGAVGIGAILIFFLMKNVPQLKQNHSVLLMIRGALAGVVAIYIIIAHANDVMIMFGKAGRVVEEAQQKSAERGKKAAQAMKQLDTMVQDTKKMEQDLGVQSAEPQDHGK